MAVDPAGAAQELPCPAAAPRPAALQLAHPNYGTAAYDRLDAGPAAAGQSWARAPPSDAGARSPAQRMTLQERIELLSAHSLVQGGYYLGLAALLMVWAHASWGNTGTFYLAVDTCLAAVACVEVVARAFCWGWMYEALDSLICAACFALWAATVFVNVQAQRVFVFVLALRYITAAGRFLVRMDTSVLRLSRVAPLPVVSPRSGYGSLASFGFRERGTSQTYIP
eukprot:TRINITY_DN3019_c0_g1_i3.p1 TRINITY_DN3019_c0_g1~~TRINITY_DN3019_c0_g1_i3.p1  ORF type:complete len:225 (+),score=56.51 TRINITY_DN3019_c0_g1_i3:57-731(+)